jgi:glycosyltransferase involved in cell wall biosynthesis
MPDPLSDRMVDTLAARSTDVVVAVSERLRDDLIARHIVPARRVQVVRNGVDTGATPAYALGLSLRDELRLSAEVPVIGSIGRLESIKGFDVMIDAFGRLLANWSDPVKPALVVAGEGSERQRLEGMIKERNLQSNVFLLGWRNDALALHALFSVFTLSSRSEGTSVSLLEAMSSGLCPVVTDVGGNRAVLGAELAHRLVPSEDAAGLAAAWRDALQNSERRCSDGRIARTRVSREFSLGAMIGAYERLYSTASHNGLGLS